MPTVHIAIGLPGSGKTTSLRQLASKLGAVYVCPYDIRAELSSDAKNQSCTPQAWEEAYRRIEQSLRGGEDVVVDSTMVKPEDRARLIAHCRESGATEIRGIWFQTSLAVCMSRNRHRERTVPDHAMRRMADFLEKYPPSKTEGFDTLRRFKLFGTIR